MSNSEKSSNFVPIINDKGVIDYGELKKQTDGILSGEYRIKCLSPEEELGRIEGGRRNVEASLLLRGDVDANGTQQSNTRERQESILKEYAKKESIWISPETIDKWKLINDDVTMESRVYREDYLFSDTALELIGFTETYGATKETGGTFFAPVYRQKYIVFH
ncbi:hypothetical protein AGMMS49965_17290 [Bacteroidia bacterium]|nr:hypothetical protein AGMMS49965_17290 [Bacteroidia bacterium]